MKILHTADLHLGRLFHDYSLIEDQEYMLRQLIEIAEQGTYDALIIAGDVYDRSIPSPEAVNLFSSFLEQLRRRCPKLHIFLIPGNHDSADRLGFGSALFSSLNIHIVCDPEDSDKAIIIEDASGEKLAIFLLPFLTPGSLTADNYHVDDWHHEDGLDNLPLRLRKSLDAVMTNKQADYSLLAAHLFTLGGKKSESERLFLGTAEQIDAKLFSAFDYVALGHLHRCQQVQSNIYYAGSPLAYSFDEAAHQKVFLSLDFSKPIEQASHESGELFSSLNKKAIVDVSKIPVKPLRKVSRLKGTFNDFFSSVIPISDDVKNGYIEISLEDIDLVENPLALLRSRFPHLLSIRQDEAFTGLAHIHQDEKSVIHQENNRRGLAEDFTSFLEEIYGQADPEKTKLFETLLKESDYEAD